MLDALALRLPLEPLEQDHSFGRGQADFRLAAVGRREQTHLLLGDQRVPYLRHRIGRKVRIALGVVATRERPDQGERRDHRRREQREGTQSKVSPIASHLLSNIIIKKSRYMITSPETFQAGF